MKKKHIDFLFSLRMEILSSFIDRFGVWIPLAFAMVVSLVYVVISTSKKSRTIPIKDNDKANKNPIMDYVMKNVEEDDQLKSPIYGRKRAIIAFILIPIIGVFILLIISHFEDTYQVMGVFGLVSMSAVFILFGFSIGFYYNDWPPFIKSLIKRDFRFLKRGAWESYVTELFKKYEYDEGIILELKLIKVMIYILIGLLVALAIISNITSMEQILVKTLGRLFIIQTAILLIPYAGFLLLFMIELIIRKDFKYYLAKACVKISNNDHKDSVRSMDYLLQGLHSYNKFLARRLNFKFDETRVLEIACKEQCYNKIRNFIDAFENNDKLKPFQTIAKWPELLDKDFLLRRRGIIGDKIIDWGTLAATVIPVVITILTLMGWLPSLGS